MSALTKKVGPGVYLSGLTGVLGIAGLITLVISSTMNSAYSLNGLSMLVVLAIAGVALIALAAYASLRGGNGDYLRTISVMAAIALFTAVIGNTISSRILLISGLFSYNAGNMPGWSVFYITVASIVCFLASILLLIVGAFLKSSK